MQLLQMRPSFSLFVAACSRNIGSALFAGRARGSANGEKSHFGCYVSPNQKIHRIFSFAELEQIVAR